MNKKELAILLLGKLSEEIGAELTRGADTQISGISADSKHIMQGDLFVCFKGEENDGHDFAAEAVACIGIADSVTAENNRVKIRFLIMGSSFKV